MGIERGPLRKEAVSFKLLRQAGKHMERERQNANENGLLGLLVKSNESREGLDESRQKQRLEDYWEGWRLNFWVRSAAKDNGSKQGCY